MTISVSLVTLIAIAVVLAGVSIWAAMYALNLQGYNGFSLVVMNQTAQNVVARTRQFMDAPIYTVQVERCLLFGFFF